MIQFKSKKGTLLLGLIFCLIQLVVSILILSYLNQDYIILLLVIDLVILLLVAYLMFILTTTKYTVVDNKLLYESGLMNGFINVSEIRKITIGKTMWSGKKPATATKGLIIRYNMFDEIYISPESNNDLVEVLLKLNHKIEIKDLT